MFAYLREGDGERMIVALNFDDRPKRVTVPVSADVAISTAGERAHEKLRGSFELGRDEGLVARLDS